MRQRPDNRIKEKEKSGEKKKKTHKNPIKKKRKQRKTRPLHVIGWRAKVVSQYLSGPWPSPDRRVLVWLWLSYLFVISFQPTDLKRCTASRAVQRFAKDSHLLPWPLMVLGVSCGYVRFVIKLGWFVEFFKKYNLARVSQWFVFF